MGIQCLMYDINVQNDGNQNCSLSNTELGQFKTQRWQVSSCYSLLHRPDWNYHWRLHRNVLQQLLNVSCGHARVYVLQKCRENLGIFLHVSVCEGALISKVTLLVGIHWLVQVSISCPPSFASARLAAAREQQQIIKNHI